MYWKPRAGTSRLTVLRAAIETMSAFDDAASTTCRSFARPQFGTRPCDLAVDWGQGGATPVPTRPRSSSRIREDVHGAQIPDGTHGGQILDADIHGVQSHDGTRHDHTHRL